MDNEMIFLGKNSFLTATGGLYVGIDKDTGILNAVKLDAPMQEQKFNVYGSIEKFYLQGSNGRYVCVNSDGSGYMASRDRNDSPVLFSLEDAGNGFVRVVDHGDIGTGQAFCWKVENSVFSRVADTQDTFTYFKKVSIAPGVEVIKKQLTATGADLSWAYLAEQDFSRVNFSGANLTNATLSGVILEHAVFQGSATNLSNADLTGASLKNAVMTTTTMRDADFTGANLFSANLSDAMAAGSVFDGANLLKSNIVSVNFENTSMVGACLQHTFMVNARFNGADLSNADLTYSMINNVNFSGAAMVSCNLSNLNLTLATFNEDTVLTGAKMQNVNMKNMVLKNMTMTHADLSGATLDGANLTGADMSYVNLTIANLRNGVQLYGASLSNAELKASDFTGAQLGAKIQTFEVEQGCAEKLGEGELPPAIIEAFKKNNYLLSADTSIENCASDNKWILRDGSKVYYIEGNRVEVTDISYAAVLTGAYMPDAVFTDANLYGVNMSGVSWYGKNAKADNADLQEVNFSNANLSTMNFTQARMNGCNFDFANAVDTIFKGAILRPSASSRQVSFSFANLQGAVFSEAVIADAVFTNAGISMNDGPYFNLSPVFIKDLDSAVITDGLRKAFSDNGYVLDNDAFITVDTTGKYWIIKNGASVDNPIFNIVNVQNVVAVYGRPIGVHLFDLSVSFIPDLDAMRISDGLKEAFKDNGFPLIDSASVDFVVKKGEMWHIKDFIEDSETLQKGYVEFYIVNKKNSLYTYGITLMFVRTGDNHTMEQVRASLATTRLTPDLLNENTTCANGQKLKVYFNQKPFKKVTWEQIMTATTPPRPPKCIPDPWHWCGD